MLTIKTRRVVMLGATVLVAAASAVAGNQLASADAASPHQIARPLGAPAAGRAVPHAVSSPAAPSTIFVPLTPCRVADTRSAGGVLQHGSTRNFYVAGTAGFPGQGGTSGGCAVPVGAASVALTITVLTPTGSGALVVYPAGTARPPQRVMSFTKPQTTTSAPIVNLADTAGQQMSLYNASSSGSTHVVIDVNGYYIQQIHALVYVSASPYVYSGSSRFVSATAVSTGKADFVIDRDVSFCTVVATGDSMGQYAFAYTFQGTNKIEVRSWNLNSTAGVVPVDGFVYVTITC